MTHALVTIAAPLALAKLETARIAIAALGNPANAAIRAALEAKGDEGTHFASLHAFRSPSTPDAHLLFEFSADGTEAAALKRIVDAIGAELKSIFILASDWKDGTPIGDYLTAHKVTIGKNGLFGNTGLPFVGTPGFSVGRILAERDLGAFVSEQVKKQTQGRPALDRVKEVRRVVRARFPDALLPAGASQPFVKAELVDIIQTGIWEVFKRYLWPLAVIAGVLGLFAAYAAPPGRWQAIWAFLLVAGFGFIGLVLALAISAYISLRTAEAHDAQGRQTPTRDTNTDMFAHEGFGAQNHMISITQRKPGALRWFTSRLVFWVIGFLAPRLWEPGRLSDIGTIHFARWVTIPKTRDVVFLSNYGGSWESYLEDFITKAHAGLTGVWSNTVGFPRTENLFLQGATDGDRFKRFARNSMVPTLFWYCAYPEVTTDTIRTNAKIRAGLSGVMTEDEAVYWLSLFGSAPRPAAKLVSQDIQSLVFGGLGFMPYGTCLVCNELPSDPAKARQWLRSLRDEIAFNDGQRLRKDAVLTLCLSAGGLERLGLPKPALDSFPFAFSLGMPGRARVLGDTGNDAPERWRWGASQPHCALLIYGHTEAARNTLAGMVRQVCAQAGMDTPADIPLRPVEENKTEPFGFADGTSQPLIRGTYKSLRNADSIHIVEPGEFILGYPDNRGYLPISPTLPATLDPGNKLPLVDATTGFDRALVDTTRDVGLNGTFLVIRELAQDVGVFETYCAAQAARLQHRFPQPYVVDAEFIGAKLIGRWKDGSSLVRYPYESRTRHYHRVEAENAARKHDNANEALAVPSPDASLSRTASNPQDGAPVDAARAQAAVPTSPAAGTTTNATASKNLHKTFHIRPDNDFLFGAEDPQALRCPFGSHVRRANPRDSLDPGSADQVAISNKHRIIRVGRHYDPVDGRDPGLFFMCLCADIERQFEFLQQTWLKSPSFHGLNCEKDPVLGDGQKGNCGYTIPTPDGPVALDPMPQFVTTRGGGYFFLPGRRLVDFLLDQ